jgi:hypothetical protein
MRSFICFLITEKIVNSNLKKYFVCFAEVSVYNGGLVDYLYSNVGETIDVKLKVDEYIMISDDDDPCISENGYSANIVRLLVINNPCFGRHVKPLVPVAFAIVSTYSSFKEG